MTTFQFIAGLGYGGVVLLGSGLILALGLGVLP